MLSCQILVLLVVGMIAAKPIAERAEPMHAEKRIACDELAAAAVAHKAHRQARQGYYSPYDYYYSGGLPYDTSLYTDFYAPINYLTPDYYYQQPIHRPTRRRDTRPFGPSTQKYTIWDLA